MVFETVLGFVSVSNKIETTEKLEFDNDGYILKLKKAIRLKSNCEYLAPSVEVSALEKVARIGKFLAFKREQKLGPNKWILVRGKEQSNKETKFAEQICISADCDDAVRHRQVES